MSFSSKGRNLFNECFEWYFSKKNAANGSSLSKDCKACSRGCKTAIFCFKNDDDKSLSIFICNRVELFLN